MTRPTGLAGAAIALILLAGCATGAKSEVDRIATQYHEHVYALWVNNHGVEIVQRDCPRFSDGTRPSCVDVPGTSDPHDVEYWRFKMYRVTQMALYGAIPVSPRYKSGVFEYVGITGNRERCDQFRAPIVKPKGVAGNDGESLTEPCEGPYYFRRVPARSASAERTSIWHQPGAETPPRPLGAGDPIPIDTPDPKYRAYFDKVRERIKANWVYPRQAGVRNIEGELLIEFHIGKDGRLAFIELRRASGTPILDDAALTAVKIAQPFPPVPDELLSEGLLAISGQFRYQIVGGYVNQFMR